MGSADLPVKPFERIGKDSSDFSKILTDQLLEKVVRPGQYLGNEWGAFRKSFSEAEVRMVLAFPDLYELGMSNFGLKILYQIVNSRENFMADRCYAPASDMEALLRERNLPLWAWESRTAMNAFELIGFSLQYELTYTNVLNMLELAQIPVMSADRESIFPLIFGGGPSSVNPEPMADFMDFFMIGDGEDSVPLVMSTIEHFKKRYPEASGRCYRRALLLELAAKVPGVYAPSLYEVEFGQVVAKPVAENKQLNHDCDLAHVHCSFRAESLPERVLRQTMPLNNSNQPTSSMVPYLSLVHDREVLEVRRGCDRGCRFCQPGYTFLPVRERSAEDILELSKVAMANSGHQEYSMLSLCVSDYTQLHESVRALNEEHSARRSSLSFPSQRADRMNLDLAEELKSVRKSGITLAPEAGSERLRAIINKGLSHEQIISAIEAAYQSGWASIKLYFMCGLPLETDEDLAGIVEILKEATTHCRVIRKNDPTNHKKDVEFTCTISNFVPKPFTPFQWYGQITPEETSRRHKVLREKLREARLRNVQLNLTDPQISLLEAVISRGDRLIGTMIHDAWRSGATFDAWDEKFVPARWHEAAAGQNTTLEAMACTSRTVGSPQPWEVVHIGLNNWWLIKEWEKAVAQMETPPCTENLCHACGVCTELETTHLLASPKPEVMKRNPFVKELAHAPGEDSHPSIFFMAPETGSATKTNQRLRFQFTKLGDLRFISHLDLQHLLARAARRAAVDLAYTNGFNPSPKINLAAPLPLFQESTAEIAEIDLATNIEPDLFQQKMNAQLPAEIQLTGCTQVYSNHSLASALGGATYHLEPILRTADETETGDRLRTAIKDLLDKTEVLAPVKNDEKGAPKNIRPGITKLRLLESSPLTIEAELAHGSTMHVKPNDVIHCLDAVQEKNDNILRWRITRIELKSQQQKSLFTYETDATN